MKNKTIPVLLMVFLFTFISKTYAAEAINFVGTYELHGMMEMAGAITLKPNHTYEAGFSYGAADWLEEGDWKEEGEGVLLSGSRFKVKSKFNSPLFLPSGTHFSYKDGKLTASNAGGSVTFINPNKTKSSGNKPGEGRMRVQGKVMKIDSGTLTVKTKEECMMFDVYALSNTVLKAAKLGAILDVEIPYSAIIGGGSC